jgi:two-component system sensor histidine kinase KdpD
MVVREPDDQKQDTRPDPDALLKEIERQEVERGRLKIFLGYAPGVGKTYTMLQEAHVLRGRGEDVVGEVSPSQSGNRPRRTPEVMPRNTSI